MSLKGMKKIRGKLKFGSGSPLSEADWSKYDDRLMESVDTNDVTKLKATLAKKGVSCTKLSEDGKTAIHTASMKGNFDCLNTMLKLEKPDLSVTDLHGRTALHLAARGGHLECMDSLLEFGIPIDFQDTSSMTALHYAVSSGHKGCVDILLKYGSPVNLTDKEGRSPLILAVQAGHTAIVDLLIDYESNVNIQDNYGKTALMYASEYNMLDFTTKLIARGAKIGIKDFAGKTAEMFAAEKKYKDLEDILKTALENEKSKEIQNDHNRNIVRYNSHENGTVLDVKPSSTPDASKEVTVINGGHQEVVHEINGETTFSDMDTFNLLPELEGTFLSSSFSSRKDSSPDSQEVEGLRNKIRKLQDEVDTLKVKLDEAHRTSSQTGPSIPLVVYQQLKIDSENTIKDLNNQVNGLKNQVIELQDKNTLLTKSASTSTEEMVPTIEAAENDVQSRIPFLEKDNERLREQNQLLLQQLEVRKEIEKEQNKKPCQNQEIEEETVEDKMGEYESKIKEQVAEERERLETDIKNLKEQNASLEKETQRLESNFRKTEEKHRTEISTTKKKISEIEEENKQLKDTIAAKEAELQSQHEQSEKEKDMSKNADSLQEENEKLKQMLAELENQQESHSHEQNLEEEVRILRSKCEEQMRGLIKAKDHERTLKVEQSREMSGMRREMSHLQKELKEAVEEKAQLSKKYDEQVEENQKQIEFYEGELSVLESELQHREEKHKQTIQVYRMHLLSFYLGTEDDKLESILAKIVQLKRQSIDVAT